MDNNCLSQATYAELKLKNNKNVVLYEDKWTSRCMWGGVGKLFLPENWCFLYLNNQMDFLLLIQICCNNASDCDRFIYQQNGEWYPKGELADTWNLHNDVSIDVCLFCLSFSSFKMDWYWWYFWQTDG